MSKKDEALKLALKALILTPDPSEQNMQAVMAIREALAEQPAQQEPVNKYCCHLCFNKSGQMFLDRMILCPECGNKRCPKATYHELPCTNSNEPGQPGSIYTSPPASKPWVGLTPEERQACTQSPFTSENYLAIEAKLREKNA